MIIQLRGTSGSGKSTAMRKFMARYDWEPHGPPNNPKSVPLYYTCGKIAVLGNYSNKIGGGWDTVPKPYTKQAFGSVGAAGYFNLCKKLLADGFEYLICEGLMVSEDVRWTQLLPDVHCLFLTTPAEKCLEWVEKRRTEKGNAKSVHEKKELSKTGKKKPTAAHRLYLRSRTIERARNKLLLAGVDCRRCTANQAPEIITSWLADRS